ncbi:hypothetical protein K432DRAFT_376976 [Lepidopterella palustris CBS 459.81]|uniref:Uncharacterized protein n=1 Tax=Lepidopterella palustris CBS 459.81 TaxID=1314670 RepID=A0A8E2ELJ0_9PEZI|nr:hypothetical protein K432DRAFT_376976 [Lepidopterella palustris CBS 459.81]
MHATSHVLFPIPPHLPLHDLLRGLPLPQDHGYSYVQRVQNLRKCEGIPPKKRPLSIYQEPTCSIRVKRLDPTAMTDKSSLCRVLEIDKDNQFAIAEPNNTMNQLVKETLN